MASNSIRLLGALVLGASFVIYFLSLKTLPAFVIHVSLTTAILSFVVALFRSQASFFLLGLLICVMPILGSGALSVVITAWILGRGLLLCKESEDSPEPRSSRYRLAVFGFGLLILSQAVSAFMTYVYDFDFLLLSSIFHSGRLLGLYYFFTHNALSWFGALQTLTGWFISFALLLVIARSAKEQDENGFLFGLLFGVFIASLYGVCQILGLHPLFDINRAPFWLYVGRYSASFSDPNAFGLMAAMLVPILFWVGRYRKPRWAFILGSLMLLSVVVWSGSRSFWLGLFFWLLWFGYQKLRASSHFKCRALVLGFCVFSFTLILVGEPRVNRSLQNVFRAPGVSRMLKTLNWDNAEEMFASRVVFSRIALKVISENAGLGVGLNRFQSLAGVTASELGVELHGWRDNANNFYLHVLAEQGLVGFWVVLCAFLLFACSLAAYSEKPVRGLHDCVEPNWWNFSRVSLLIFCLLLLTGPHVHFDEVRYFICTLLAFGIRNADRLGGDVVLGKVQKLVIVALGSSILLLSIAVLMIIAADDPARDSGLYNFEQGERGVGDRVVWTGGAAKISFCAAPSNNLTLELRALHPDIGTRPVKVGLYWLSAKGEEGKVFENVTLRDTSWQRVLLKARKNQSDAHEVLGLTVDRLWSPKSAGLGADARQLGVMLRWPEEACR